MIITINIKFYFGIYTISRLVNEGDSDASIKLRVRKKERESDNVRLSEQMSFS